MRLLAQARKSILPVAMFGDEQKHGGYGFPDAQLRIKVRASRVYDVQLHIGE
jgi:hypothetical protein